MGNEGKKHIAIRDTLNPNESGNSSKSFLSKVLLPVPLGPEITTGRKDADAVGAILDAAVDAADAVLRRSRKEVNVRFRHR